MEVKRVHTTNSWWRGEWFPIYVMSRRSKNVFNNKNTMLSVYFLFYAIDAYMNML